jgi:hypothetical protein
MRMSRPIARKDPRHGERTETKADAEAAVPEKIAEMPAYAKDGKVVCFVQAAAKFKSRCPTLGFDDSAKLDDEGCGLRRGRSA